MATLIKAGTSKIINIDNVNSFTYTPSSGQYKESTLLIMYQRNQYDDTNVILTLKGAEADDVWSKANNQAT